MNVTDIEGLDVKSVKLLTIAGAVADELGEERLQAFADEAGTPLIVEGWSSHHMGKIIRPSNDEPVIPVTGKDIFGIRSGDAGDERGRLWGCRFDDFDEAQRFAIAAHGRGWVCVQQLTAKA